MKPEDYSEDKHDTIVAGVANGKKTESGNYRHNDDGTFASRTGVFGGKTVECVPLSDTTTKRDEANQLVYDVAENGKLTRIPQNFEEACEIFELSCSVEHEKQIKENKYDDQYIQPYTQKHIIKKIMEKYWDLNIPCQILFNPYNKHDIAGCDYWLCYGTVSWNQQTGKFEWNGKDFEIHSIDQKTNSGSTHRLIISKQRPGMKRPEKGFFVNEERKINDYLLFTNIDSFEKNKKTLGDYNYHKIDGTTNLFMPKDEFEKEIKTACGFGGSKKEFFDYLYDNIAPKLTKLLKSGINDFGEDDGAQVVYTKSGMKVARVKIGNYYVKARKTSEQVEVFLDFNDVEETIGPKYENDTSSESYFFSEEEGAKEYVESKVNENNKSEIKKTLQNERINKLFGF